MTDLSGIVGDTNTYTISVLRHWYTTLAQTSEAGATGWTLSTLDDVEVGDTVTVGSESRVITSLPGEDFVTFDDPTLEDHPLGEPAYGVGVVDLDTGTVTFRIGDLVSKAVTMTDPAGAAVVVLDPADTADIGVIRVRHFWWDLTLNADSGSIKTLDRGRFALSQRA